MKIEVYQTEKYCPWCVKLKDRLKSEGIKFDNKVLTTDREKDFLRKQGIMTVPAVFIDGKYIGGHDDAVTLIENGDI